MNEVRGEAWKGDFSSLEVEIDLDYEFDASKYFDFSREESYGERSETELWFQTAKSYPPCPFIRSLIMGIDEVVENVNILPKFKDTENPSNVYAHSSTGFGSECSALNESYKGRTVQYNIVEDDCIENNKFTKGPFTKGSSLMKPTASQLAKQNRDRGVIRRQFIHRLPKPHAQTCKETVEDSSENAGLSVKRQKLEGGRLLKVVGVKEQRDLLHKAPQKKIVPVDVTSQHSRLRITIPREPDLETAQRAQRLRSSVSRQPQEEGRSTTSIFRACPLNRKILKAPLLPLPQKSTPRLPQFQPFNLKTEERALQHFSRGSSLSVANDTSMVSTAQVCAPRLRKFRCHLSGLSQPQNHNKKQDECDAVHPMLKARPLLNKKILSSKGDFGVIKNTKREITKPKEFNFSMDKRCQQDPPTDLFNKLSLNTEAQKTSASHTRSMWHFDEASKGSKENIDYTAQQGQKVHVKKEELYRHVINQVKSEVSVLPNHRPQTSKLAVTQAFGDHNGI